MRTNVMIDLETLGTSAGCKILSIGAVEFYQNGTYSEFYRSIKHKDQQGRVDEETLDWWEQRDEDSRAVLTDPQAISLQNALGDFAHWFFMLDHEDNKFIWGNGSDFDQPILVNRFEAVGLEVPWRFYNSRCYRTIKNLFPDTKIVREGVYHNALDDAISQAKHLTEIAKNNSLNIW